MSVPRLSLSCVAITVLFSFAASSLWGETRRVAQKSDFVALVQGQTLTRKGIRLSVAPDGVIRGRAFGLQVRGQWRWQDGFFCRDLFWGDRDLGPNCQQVTIRGDVIRFTSDRGTGQYADLTLR